MFEFRVETTGTTGKNNFIKVRGLTRPRFFCVDIIRRMARAGSPVHKRKVVSKKLFPKSNTVKHIQKGLLALRLPSHKTLPRR